MNEKRHPLREPMVWLLIALPLAAIIGSIWLVVESSRGGSIDVVADDVQRTGQIQTSDTSPDLLAANMRLGAVFQYEGDSVHVFPAGGEFPRHDPLQLMLLHPQEKSGDTVLVLTPDETGWHGTLTVDPGHDWQVILSDKAVSWRIRGRLPKGQRAAHLGSSLADK